MKWGAEAAVAAAVPVFGPAIVTVLGIDIPVLALVLSIAGLLLSRVIAPPALRQLTGRQETALNCLLAVILFLIVTGTPPLGNGEPIGAGMGVIWGIGFGFSGLLVIEFFGEWTMNVLRAMMGRKDKQ